MPVVHKNCCREREHSGAGALSLSALPEQREGELTPLLSALPSTADLDFPCELDTNSPVTLTADCKCAAEEVGCAASDYFTPTTCSISNK